MYRGVRGRNAQGGMEKCTVEGWSSSEMHMCDRQSDTLTRRHKKGVLMEMLPT